jgi:hypothetical protein
MSQPPHYRIQAKVCIFCRNSQKIPRNHFYCYCKKYDCNVKKDKICDEYE